MALNDAKSWRVAAFLGGRGELLRAFDGPFGRRLAPGRGCRLRSSVTQMSFRAGVLFGCVSLRGGAWR